MWLEIRCPSRYAGRSGLGPHAKKAVARTHQSKLAWHHRRNRWEPTVCSFRVRTAVHTEAEFMWSAFPISRRSHECGTRSFRHFRSRGCAASRRQPFPRLSSRGNRSDLSQKAEGRTRVTIRSARSARVVRRTACRGKGRAACGRKEATARSLRVSRPRAGDAATDGVAVSPAPRSGFPAAKRLPFGA